MRHRQLFFGGVLWLTMTMAAHAEIYTWTDEQGTVHFTEDASSIPLKLRKTLRRTAERGATGAETTPDARPAEEGSKAGPTEEKDAAQSTELFDFTTREQWSGELMKQESAMVELRKRLDDIASKVGSIPARTAERDKLMAEHQALRAEFSAMKARYYRLVEAARKAGFQVDLQQ